MSIATYAASDQIGPILCQIGGELSLPRCIISATLSVETQIGFPGNDAAHARIYFEPLFSDPNADQVPVTLSFVPDRAGDGQMNMVVQVQGISMLFLNRTGTFQPVTDAVLVADRHE